MRYVISISLVVLIAFVTYFILSSIQRASLAQIEMRDTGKTCELRGDDGEICR